MGRASDPHDPRIVFPGPWGLTPDSVSMTESFAAYRARLLGYLGDRDPIRVLQATPSRLESRLEGIRRPLLTRRPAPTSWSILEVVAHMADAELAMAWRIRNVLASPGIELAWFDQDRWAAELGYNSRSLRPQLALFRALREGNLALLRSVPQRRWQACYGVHELRGRQTVADFVRMEAAHDLAHLRQIRAILGAEQG